MEFRIPKLHSEHFFGIFLALFWGQDILVNYVRAVLLRIPYIKYAADYVFPVLMFVCLLLALPYLAKSISWRDILFAVLAVVVFVMHILLYPQNEELLSISGTFFVAVFPLYFIGLRFEVSKHWRFLYIMSIVNIWAFGIYYILLGSNAADSNQAGYTSYMHRAYVLLPQLLVVLVEIFKKSNLLNILTGLAGLSLLLMCGNRGSVLLLLIFTAFCVLYSIEKKKRFIVYAGVISAGAVIFFYYELLFGALISLFMQLGMSTRVFDRLLEGTFFESNGRDVINNKLAAAILENPIFGYGLASDRTIAGSYAHNYAMELWAAFGVIVGSAILAATVYVIGMAWLKTKEKTARMFLFVLICVGFLKIFISSSFLHEGLFFLLIGVCVAQLRKSRPGLYRI